MSGTWSGAITSGDTLRDSDAGGLATFYSARSRSPGEVQFCVTGASFTGKSYDDTSNVETCSTIPK